jgi:hypothetical protein
MIAVVAHDAGGAEILSSYVRREGVTCRLVLAGPALAIFARKLGPIEVCEPDKALSECDWVLCGSSYPSEFELKFLANVRAQGKRSVVFLDHWINYRERFLRDGAETLPDEIWVGDADAELTARTFFPDTTVTLVDNPYFEDLRDELKLRPKRLQPADKIRALFLSQPIRQYGELGGRNLERGYTEEEALQYFIDNVDRLAEKVDEVVIRLHPTEASDKYDWVNDAFDIPVVVEERGDLTDAILSADYVVGMDSMAMVVGLLADKEVICCIPTGGQACRLPQAGILSLRDQ